MTAVLDRLSSFHWDVPNDCLLTMSQCIGAHMGGTSGAVSDTPSSPIRQHYIISDLLNICNSNSEHNITV